MLTSLQYRVLKRIAPMEPSQMSGAAYAGQSKLQVLLGDRLLRALEGRVVIDFGCGEGHESVEMASAGARVIGVDIREGALEAARANAARAGVGDRCHFCTNAEERADFVVSIDSFEHFSDPAAVLRRMYQLLRPGGKVFASFGPTWFHPYGGHLFSVFPWAHLVFSERALIQWRSDIRSDGAARFAEVEGGLNQMTIGRFEELLRHTNFRVLAIESIPIRRLRHLHNRLTREFTTSFVRCELERPPSQ